MLNFSASKLRLQRLYSEKKAGDVAPELLECWSEPLTSGNASWEDVKFLVVDTETSALTVDQGEMLSIGWVEISAGSINLNSARHYLLEAEGEVGQSATIHQLRDCELVEGLAADVVLKKFLAVAKGKVLVFHHAPLDIAFLNGLSLEHLGAPLLWLVADTLEIEKQKLQRKSEDLGGGKLRLAHCRSRYHLPDYPAHNALVDAIATAELLLAQIRYKGEDCQLDDLLC